MAPPPMYERLGAVIREVRGKRTQRWLADAAEVDQTTLSYYELGKSRIPLDFVQRVEEVLGLEHGEILVRAGLVSPSLMRDREETATATAIATDPDLEDEARDLMQWMYAYCQRHGRLEREAVEHLAEARAQHGR